MPTTTSTDSLDTATADSQEALAAMESDAAEFFANRDSADAAKALNPVAPALERAVESAPVVAAKPAAAVPAKAAPATATVKGAPSLKSVAAKVEAAKPAPTTAPDISDLPTEFVPGKLRSAHWDKLRANRNHFEELATAREQEAASLRAELEATRTASAAGAPSADTAARLTALAAERDSLLTKLEAVAVEKSPRFEAQFKPRRDAALSQARAAVGPAEATRMDALLALPESSYRDEQIETLLSTLPPLRATKLSQAVADLDRLATERASLASQGSELYKQWASEESSARDRATAERNARATSTFDAELREWEVAGVTPEEAAAARSVYTGKNATLQDASRASLWGAIGPRVAAALQETQARNAALEGELKKLRGAQPGIGAAASGALPAAEGDDTDDPAITGYSDRIAKAALRQGVRFGS